MNSVKRSVITTAALLILFVIGGVLCVLPFNYVFLLNSVSSFYFLFLSVGLVLYFASSIVDNRLRRYLTLIGAFILFWILLRFIKYAAFGENEFITRMLWYAYYIPMLAVPQFSFSATLSVGRPENKPLPFIKNITGTVTLIMIITVMTNDLHQLVFGFKPGFADSLTDYSHNILFWIIVGWDYAFLLFSVCFLIIKCRLSHTKKLARLLFVYAALFILWSVITLLDLRPEFWGNRPGEFPETVCFMMGGLWLLCISMGLVPSNSGYGRLFDVTSLAVQITDANYNTVYRSRSATELTGEQMSADIPGLPDKNTRILRTEVYGGYAFRQIDLTELNRLNEQLTDAAEVLAEEKELILLENELKKKRAEIETKSKTYDNIALKVLRQTHAIEDSVREAKANPECFAENMRIVCIYTVYIKRMSNLMLMATASEIIDINDLWLSLCESIRYIDKKGIITAMNKDCEELFITSVSAINIYEEFEKLTEASLPTLRALSVNLCDEVLKLTFEGAMPTLSPGFDGSAETDGDTAFIRLYPQRGTER